MSKSVLYTLYINKTYISSVYRTIMLVWKQMRTRVASGRPGAVPPPTSSAMARPTSESTESESISHFSTLSRVYKTFLDTI